MKLLGKLYVSWEGNLYIYSKEHGKFYFIKPDGTWVKAPYHRPLMSWRLIGDSYAKD